MKKEIAPLKNETQESNDEIEIIKISLHVIDIENEKIETIDVSQHEKAINKYVSKLIEIDILNNSDKRKYSFKDGDTQVKSSIQKIIHNDDDIENIILANANRLLEKEIEAEKSIAKMNKHIQRGSLLHIHFKQNKKDRLLLCKAEHDEILNEKTFAISRGLNTKKKVFKAFLVYLETDETQEEIYVNDKHNSSYWWKGFLELNQSNSDELNTEKTLGKIIQIIDRNKRKTENKLDSAILRNNIIGYFRSNQNFNLSSFISSLKDYTPHNDKYPIENVITGFSKLEDDKSFDNQFIIIPGKIDKRKTNSIRLGKGIYLNLENEIENLEQLLQPFESAGKYGMTILSDEAYNFIKQINNGK